MSIKCLQKVTLECKSIMLIKYEQMLMDCSLVKCAFFEMYLFYLQLRIEFVP